MRSLGCATVLMLVVAVGGCSGSKREPGPVVKREIKPVPTGPARIVLVDQPVQLQDEQEPFRTTVTFEFELPSRPRRARLLLRYSSVPGNKSEAYLMGKFRHKIELNDRYLMDLNTHSEGEDRVVEYTKWISVGMLKRHNVLKFTAGDDGNREGRPDCDEFDLRSAVLEFDW